MSEVPAAIKGTESGYRKSVYLGSRMRVVVDMKGASKKTACAWPKKTAGLTNACRVEIHGREGWNEDQSRQLGRLALARQVGENRT